ncbi:MAG: FAD:protein FMN transferase [Syntrophobacterales bacterium]|nr:MAG: FAD:protein FMN transferase [Syntrophobacterales bacterium]
MGTLVEISVIGRDVNEVEAAIRDAFEEMERVERLMSKKIPESDVSKINRWAGIKPVKVSAEVLKVIRRAEEISKASEGYFDISIGAILDLWELEDSGGRIPGKDEVGEILHSIDYRAIHMDGGASTVMLKKKGMRIDLGGIAKGYAVDRAFELLTSRGYRNIIVNAGGDMRVGGKKIRVPWVIGIQDPRNRSRIMATLDAAEISVATSGDYERYFEVNGKRYHHLLNPLTGSPARECRGVTILARDALSADALATAVFVMGPKRGLALIEAMEGVEGLIVSFDGEVVISEGMKGKIRFSD